MLSCGIRGRAQWGVLLAIAERHAEAKEDQLAQAIPIEALACLCDVKPDSAVRTIRRLNTRLTEEAARNGEFLQNLIEHIVARDTTENRYGFEQVEVVINGHRNASSDDSGL